MRNFPKYHYSINDLLTVLSKLAALIPWPSLATRQLLTALAIGFSYFSGNSAGNSMFSKTFD
jgi:hypothetical protein